MSENNENRDTGKAELFRTAEILRASGITRQMLYHYLHLGLVTESARTPAGHRLYDKSVLRRIELVQRLNSTGYTLRDIRETFISPARRKHGKNQ